MVIVSGSAFVSAVLCQLPGYVPGTVSAAKRVIVNKSLSIVQRAHCFAIDCHRSRKSVIANEENTVAEIKK